MEKSLLLSVITFSALYISNAPNVYANGDKNDESNMLYNFNWNDMKEASTSLNTGELYKKLTKGIDTINPYTNADATIKVNAQPAQYPAQAQNSGLMSQSIWQSQLQRNCDFTLPENSFPISYVPYGYGYTLQRFDKFHATPSQRQLYYQAQAEVQTQSAQLQAVQAAAHAQFAKNILQGAIQAVQSNAVPQAIAFVLAAKSEAKDAAARASSAQKRSLAVVKFSQRGTSLQSVASQALSIAKKAHQQAIETVESATQIEVYLVSALGIK